MGAAVAISTSSLGALGITSDLTRNLFSQKLISMVQYKPVDTLRRKRYLARVTCDETNNYWKLGLHSHSNKTRADLIKYLKDRGYKCRQNINKSAIIDAIGRHQRGLMSYQGRGVRELKTFCKARGLGTTATTASGLARALEEADDLITFPRFFDLPAEIRNIIYELFFKDLGSFDSTHVQPPLTLASSQLRPEALPLFYECATFRMSASRQWSTKRKARAVQAFTLHSTSLLYMPAANFERIKNLDLHWKRGNQREITIAIRLTTNKELEQSDLSHLALQDAIEFGLESTFKTVQSAYEMQKGNDQPLEMRNSGRLFNITVGGETRSGRSMEIGMLALQKRQM